MGRLLFAQFCGPIPKFPCTQAVATQLWGRRGRVDVMALDGDGFLFKFENLQTLNWVLEKGPWFIDQPPLLLGRWTSGMVIENLSMDVFSIRVKLRRVPLELFINEGLSRIGSAIGNPLYMDKATEMRHRVSFARF